MGMHFDTRLHLAIYRSELLIGGTCALKGFTSGRPLTTLDNLRIEP